VKETKYHYKEKQALMLA